MASEMGQRAVTILPYNLRRGQNINKIYEALGRMFDEIVSMFVEIMNSRDLDQAQGFGLDILGDILGQLRNGIDDASYTEILRTKIVANRSDGSTETLNDFGRLILGQFFNGVIDSVNPAEVVLKYTYPVVANPEQLMSKITAAGVNVTTKLDNYVPICGTYTCGSTSFEKVLI